MDPYTRVGRPSNLSLTSPVVLTHTHLSVLEFTVIILQFDLLTLVVGVIPWTRVAGHCPDVGRGQSCYGTSMSDVRATEGELC